MRFKFWRVAAIVGMTLLPLAAAYASKEETVVKAENKSDFDAMVSAVHQQMAPGGHWEFVDSTERQQVDAGFADMESLFAKYGTVDQMNNEAKAKLYSDQEDINGILTRRDSRKLVCKSERPIGSLLPKRTCRTYGDIQRDRDNSQQFMQQQARPTGNSGH